MNYHISKLTPDSYRIYSPLGVFMDLIVGRNRALLLDTGYGLGDLAGAVRSLTDLPLIVVNSHGHLDHTCGNDQFEEPAYIHPLDMELCRMHNSDIGRSLILNLARHCPSEGKEINLLPENFDCEAFCTARNPRLLPVTEGHFFDLGGIHLKVIELPGHTPGSIGLLREETNTLYVGDAFNDNTWLFLPEALNLAVYRQTLNKAAAIRADRFVFSHKPGFTDPSVLDDYMDLAANLDYASGLPFETPLVPGTTARLCCRKGFTPEDAGKPGYASIVITGEHL